MSQRSYTTAIDYSVQDNRFFIKFFLLDASLNYNRWGVTNQSIQKHINTFLGKAFVVTEKLDHLNGKDPKSTAFEEALKIQEKFRAGTIIDVGYDERSGKAWAKAEITDKKAQELIKQGKIRYVSPSISFRDEDIIKNGEQEIITDFIGMHVAGVSDPAFGVVKAQIKGTCTGSEHECSKQLQMVQACYRCGEVHYRQAPMGEYKDFDDCVSKNQDKDDPEAYCGEVKRKIEGSSLEHNNPSNKTVMSDNSKSEEIIKQLQAEVATYKQKLAMEHEGECPEGEHMVDGECKKKQEVKLTEANKRIADLESRLLHAERSTPVERIIKAKTDLGKLKPEEASTESEKLFKLDTEMLNEMAAEYDGLVTAKTQINREVRMPKYQYASTTNQDQFTKSAYSILKELGGK